MDISGLTAIILQEYTSYPGIFFENHVYGCLTLLEERLADSSNVDVSAQWQQIGAEYGFFRDPLCIYEGSPAYRSAWQILLGMDGSAQFVDDLEDAVIEALDASTFFSYGVDHGDLSPELAEAALKAMKPAKRLLSKSRKGVRVATPPKVKGARFIKTRRQKVVVTQG
uniref:Uncharacterized protein n=1 Tax=viral metagenome TaxID=1070528 RepID=A0A6C0K1V5_9ZZZZ